MKVLALYMGLLALFLQRYITLHICWQTVGGLGKNMWKKCHRQDEDQSNKVLLNETVYV